MTESFCPTCHSPIPSHAPGGFCPACVLRGAEETAAPLQSGGPALEAVQASFPDLEIESLIGHGGMGFVYKARQPSLDRTVALKILAPGLSADPAFAERFAREARVLGKLNHPNIVTVHGHGVNGGFYYLLMEYVDGVNLRQAMRTEPFSPSQALSVVPGICDALQAAHAEGIWHRDIKPENILLDSRGQVRIVDFGIARLVGDPLRDFTLTVTGAALGSAVYMAPEQHETPHDVDHRADIYSLGVVIYEMLTGELPLGRFPAPSQRAAVNARIDEIVLRTLEKERALRQQSADEVKTELSELPPSKTVARHPNPITNYGQWSLRFFVAGILGFPLLSLIFARAETFFLTGVLILLAMVFGLFGWKTRLGKFVAAAAASVLVMTAAVTTMQVLEKEKSSSGYAAPNPPSATPAAVSRTSDSAESPGGNFSESGTSVPTAGKEVTQARSRESDPAKVPRMDVLEVFRSMNLLANARDIAAFQNYSPQRQVLFTGDAPVAEKMLNFTGELVRLHLAEQKETRPAPIGFGVMKGSAEVAALIKAPDGTMVWRAYRFQKKENNWKYIHLSSLKWQSTAVVEFQPAGRDGLTELRAHLDESVTVELEEGKVARFRLGTPSTGDPPYGPDRARFVLQTKLKSLEESLKKSGLEGTLKILSPPGIPDEPVHSPDPPAKAESSPANSAIAPVPVPETARLQTDVSFANGVRTVKTRFITDQGEVFPNVAAANAALRAQAPSAPGEHLTPQPGPAEGLTGTPDLEKWSGSGRVAFTARCGSSPMFTLLGKGVSSGHQLHTSGSLIIQPSYLDFDGMRIHFAVPGPRTATIAGRTFDLSQGRVFTMSASGIRQFPLDCPLKLTDATMRELLEKTGTGDQTGPDK